MKIECITFAALAASAAAAPYGFRRRDVEVVPRYITTNVKVIQYVDQDGNLLSTTVQAMDAEPTDPSVFAQNWGQNWGQGNGDAYTTTTLSSSSSSSSFTPTQNTEVSSPPATGSVSEDPADETPDDYQDGDTQNGEVVGYSVAYAPYNADGTCKTEQQINDDVAALKDYSMIRIYGTDCDQIPLMLAAAEQHDMQIFAGIWDPANAASEAQALIAGTNGDWSRIHSISIGNEALSNNMSLDTLRSGISTAKEMLQGAAKPYPGLFTTVEAYSKLWEFKDSGLCDDIDFVAANIHAFFDAGETPENAGNFVRQEANRLRTEFCDKDVVVTESGWPTNGETNGLAIPNSDNQRIAIDALRKEFSADKDAVILFSAFNDAWKEDNEGTFGSEKFWGMYGDAPSAYR